MVKGKPVYYEPPKLADARSKLMSHLSPHRPERQLNGPVRLVVRWLFPKTAGHSDGQYKDTRPDTDNLIKLLKDCMTALDFWRDDAQVASELNEKFWAKKPGIYIRAEELQ